MSKVLEKSLGGFLHSLLGTGQTTSNLSSVQSLQTSVGLHAVSLGLVNFVERLEAARKISKQEEEEIVSEEYQEWVRMTSHQNTGNAVIADNLCRSLIAFSRGHYFTNLHISAIKLTQSEKLLHKKAGYLYISRTMAPGSDLTVLLVNTVQRDLSSQNVIQIASGLNLIPTIVTPDISPLIANSLLVCLRHHQVYIRRRAAVMASALISQNVDTHCNFSSLTPLILNLISDTDPAVAIAATMTLSCIYKTILDPCVREEFRDQIASSCSNILYQATSGSLSQHFNTGPTNAPFVQVQMLRVIQNLSTPMWKVPKETISAVKGVLLQPWGGRDLTLYVTLLEGVTTVTSLPRHDDLITQSLKIVLGFLKSSLVDFKYLGIKALINIFNIIEDNLTESHLEAVLECLYSSSQLLQSKTMRLMCSMANKHNYQAICTTLMEFSQRTNLPSTRVMVLDHLTNIIKRMSVDIPWCISFLSPLIVIPNAKKEFLEALTIATNNGMERAKSDEEKHVIVKSCNKLFSLLLALDNMTYQQINTVASILNIIFITKPEEIEVTTIKMFLNKTQNLKYFNSNDEVFECLLNCGLYTSQFCERVQTILTGFLNTIDLYSCLKVREKLSLLRDANITKKVLDKKAKIIAGDIKPDLSLSMYDSVIIHSLENGADAYKPSLLLNQKPSKASSQDKKTGFRNPFDTGFISPTLIGIDNESVSTSTSLQSSFVVSNSSVISGATPCGNISSQQIWTPRGRLKPALGADHAVSATLEDETMLQMSSSRLSNSCVEIAHEADESSMISICKAEHSTNPLNFLDAQRADLTQALLKGLGLSKH